MFADACNQNTLQLPDKIDCRGKIKASNLYWGIIRDSETFSINKHSKSEAVVTEGSCGAGEPKA